MNAQWKAWLDQLGALPHGPVGVALAQLLMLAQIIRQGLPPEHRADWDPVPPRIKAVLERFQLAGQRPDIQARWVEPELLPTLDLLARWLTTATGTPAQEHLARILFDELDAACAAEGWFGIDRVTVGQTPFDPARHRAVEKRGDGDVIVALLRPGRTDPAEGYPLTKSEVAVGDPHVV